jgi:hypothetical protein
MINHAAVAVAAATLDRRVARLAAAPLPRSLRALSLANVHLAHAGPAAASAHIQPPGAGGGDGGCDSGGSSPRGLDLCGAVALGEALVRHGRVAALCLCRNGLDCAALDACLRGGRAAASLTSLDLRRNSLRGKGAGALVRAVALGVGGGSLIELETVRTVLSLVL